MKSSARSEATATFRSDIIGGAISADLLDYLRRDTYFCGLSQYYDPRIFESFIIDDQRLVMNLEKHGLLRQDALSELVNLLAHPVHAFRTRLLSPHENLIGRNDFESRGIGAARRHVRRRTANAQRRNVDLDA